MHNEMFERKPGSSFQNQQIEVTLDSMLVIIINL